MPAVNSTSRSTSKRKLAHSSPVPASLKSSPSPDPVPRKKNKLLPPVSITSRQTRTSHGRPTLHHKVSYGELSAEEVESVVAHSDVDDAELSTASLHRRGHVLFVDDEASEASQHSDDPSTDDEAAGSDCDSIVRSSSSIEVICVSTPAPSDDESAGDNVIEVADSLGACDKTKHSRSRPLWSKTKTVKGAYVDRLLTSGNGDDVATDDDVKADPTVSSRGTRSKEPVSDVYLEDLCQTPKTNSRVKGKTPVKPAAGRRSSCGNKKEASSSSTRLEPELIVDPVTAGLTKTMSLSTLNSKKPLTPMKAVPCSDMTELGVTAVKKRTTRASVPTSSVPPPIKRDLPKSTGKHKAPVVVSATSTKQKSSRKGPTKSSTSAAEKTAEPLFFPSDSDTKASEPPPDRHTQLSSDLATLLGSSLRHIIDVTEPKDPALRVMQPALMEDHLVTLRVYPDSLPPLGAYCPVVAAGSTPDTFDTPRFFAFTDVVKLFRVQSLTSLVEAFKFESYGAFVNLARVPHTIVSVEKRSVHYAGSNAVCMTAGLVTECMLFEPASPGMYGAGKQVRWLRIMPFHQMFRCESTAWTLAFGLPGFVETTCINNRGLSFPTRVEDPSGHGNNNSKYTSGQSSPSKDHWGSPTKAASTLNVGPGAGYPSSLGFMDDIPIYDGRASAGSHFLFQPSDFAVLKSLPRFTASRDLDAFTMVLVGYSLSVWETFNKEHRLTPNVLFVIILGSAPKKEKLEALGFLE
ncbi:hypothetical protein IW261DRAFT_1570225 [Armillaria novae-zelandiae]|uniref:Uncharacterized protein n=1 Tax=Armillaria novae-zelandiae TaxID=153914 RepID=A0AA39U2P9_9AGAR|nr:hypothetical protein IW261DRAFT_1570225 [Armillaria novae-zelandiae]